MFQSIRIIKEIKSIRLFWFLNEIWYISQGEETCLYESEQWKMTDQRAIVWFIVDCLRI